jgi:hypothetical protein
MMPIPIFLEPERPEFQVGIKIPVNSWEILPGADIVSGFTSAKDKFLSVVRTHGNKGAVYNHFDGQFKKPRRLAGTPALIVGIVGCILNIYLTMTGFFKLGGGFDAWFGGVLLIFVILPTVYGMIAGLTWALQFKYCDIDWIEKRVGKNYVYIGLFSDSKTWLMHFLDELKEEGLTWE